MKKTLLMKSLLLLFALVVGTGSMWAATYVKVTSASELISGEVYVLAEVSTDTKYLVTGYGSKLAHTTSGFSVSGNTITTSTASPLEFTLGTVVDGTNTYYTLKYSANDYLGYNGSGTNFETATSTSNSKEQWAISPSTSAYRITNRNASTRYISRNGSNIGPYATSNSYPECYLFKKQASGKTSTSLAWSAASAEVYKGDTPSLPTLSTISPAAISSGITYSSSETNVATIDGDGNVTIGNPGTTTIKATYTEDVTYDGAEASYTLNVYGAFSSISALQTAITSAPYNTGSGTKAKVTFTNAIVNYATTNYAYIIDENGYGAVINQNGHGFTAGKIINGTVTGATLCVYSTGATILKGISSTTTGLTLTDGTVTTQTKTIDAISEANQSMMVKFENVIYNAATSSFTDGTHTIAYVDYFSKNPTVADGGKYNVTGLLIMNDGVLKVAPVSASDVVSTLINPTSSWKNGTEVLTNITIKKAEGTKKYTFETDSDAGSITYSSSKTNVATIAADGTITPVGYGTTTISANTASTSNYNADEKTFTLTVSDAGLVLYESFDGLGASGNFNASNCDNTGWTYSGSAYQGTKAARLATGSAVGSITTPALNIVSYGKIIITAKGWSTSEKGALTLSGTNCTLKTTSISDIPSTGDDYEVLFEVTGSNPKIKMEASAGHRTYIDQVSVVYADFNASVSSARYATFCDGIDRDFSGTTIKVYKALATDYSVNLEEITDGIVPANTGVVLFSESAQNNVAIPVATTAATGDFSDNDLIGINVTTKIAEAGDAGKTNYIFANGTKGVGFYKATASGAKLGAHKAYLSTTATAATARDFLGFDEDVTAIESVKTQKAEGEFFNLAGQRVAQPAKGLYIVNGKKVIIK